VAYTVVVAIVVASGVVVPLERGPIVIVQLLAPHLALACLVLIPIAAVARSRSLGVALVVVAGLFAFRFGAEWASAPAAAAEGSTSLRVQTWNLEAGQRLGPDAVALLVAHPTDIVALEELTPTVATAIESDAALSARYPYRSLSPSDGVAGIGILSRFPITDSDYELYPVRLEAHVTLPDGDLVVLAAHPFPARIATVVGIPLDFDPGGRNADLALLRSRVLDLDVHGARVLLIGDFNTAPTDPAFGRLVNGLFDAHAEAGAGPGWTWRPARFAFLGIGLLRIDLVLSTSTLRPTSTSIECPQTGDHCLLQATLELAGPT
jgi:vancomycin resistance protein VanJ